MCARNCFMLPAELPLPRTREVSGFDVFDTERSLQDIIFWQKGRYKILNLWKPKICNSLVGCFGSRWNRYFLKLLLTRDSEHMKTSTWCSKFKAFSAQGFTIFVGCLFLAVGMSSIFSDVCQICQQIFTCLLLARLEMVISRMKGAHLILIDPLFSWTWSPNLTQNHDQGSNCQTDSQTMHTLHWKAFTLFSSLFIVHPFSYTTVRQVHSSSHSHLKICLFWDESL